jgi:putative phosphotransacetylase
MQPFSVKLSISGRHLHISQVDLETLFGAGYRLTKVKDISQHGQWAAAETVTLVGPRGQIERLRILGPVRPKTQVEVSRTDAIKLGINPPVRESSDFRDTVGAVLRSESGQEVELSEGVMIAARHVHFSPQQALEKDVANGDRLNVQINGERGGILSNVIVRVRDDYDEDLHLDTDEANAFGVVNGDQGLVMSKI